METTIQGLGFRDQCLIKRLLVRAFILGSPYNPIKGRGFNHGSSFGA